MPLKDVQLLLEGYDRDQRKAFSLSHVEAVFISFLPPKYDIDGHQKILLNYVEHPTATRITDYFSLKPQIGSISSIEIDGFEPSNFLGLSHEQKEKEAARLIRDGLKEVAKRNGAPIEPIEEAYKKALESRFTISRNHKKTSKSRKDRKYRVDTICSMDRRGTSVTLEFSHKKEKIESITTARNQLWSGLWFEYWNAHWHEDEVAITDRIEREILRFRITKERKVEPVVPYNSGKSLRD